MNGFRGLGARGKEARPQKMAAGSGNAAQKNCRKVKRPHPTQKLVELMRRPILNQTKPGKLVSAVSGQRHHTRRGSDSRVPPRNLNFAKTGDPNGPGLPLWPRYDKDSLLLHLDSTITAGPDTLRPRYEFLLEGMPTL